MIKSEVTKDANIMSATTQVESITEPARKSSWALWRAQTRTIVRLETKKNFLGKRAFLIYLLALIPPLLLAIVAFILTYIDPPDADSGWSDVGSAASVFAVFYQALILRTIIFFGCAWIFMNLFRGEVIDRSLHYLFLAPVRREVLVVAKYLAGFLASSIFFSVTTILSIVFMFMTRDAAAVSDYFLRGGGISQALTYIGITILACAGYGAIFLVVGLLFRNPILPALMIYGWEFINFLLPPVLKRASVIYYLQSLAPVKPPEEFFAFVAEPSPAFVSIFGLSLFVCVLLAVAAWRIRRMEISYGTE